MSRRQFIDLDNLVSLPGEVSAPAFESLTFLPPDVPDTTDAPVNLATLFAVTVPWLFYGWDILMPSLGLPTISTGFLYNRDLATQLAAEPFAPVAVSTLQRVPSSSPPVLLSPGVTYLGGWWTDRYATRAAYPWPATSASLHTDNLDSSRFSYSPGVTMPVSNSAACYQVSPYGLPA